MQCTALDAQWSFLLVFFGLLTCVDFWSFSDSDFQG